MPTFEAKNFFNVYLSERSFQRMLIPATAVVCSNELMPATATLRNCKGRCWHVEVNKCDDNMYFGKGWRRFIDENSTKDSDSLVFSYVGWSVFDVKVLGLDGCGKSVSHVLLEEQEMEIVLVEEGERWEEQEQKEDDDNDFLEEREDCELEEEEEEEDNDDDYQKEEDSRQELEEEENDDDDCQEEGEINERNRGWHEGFTAMNNEGTTSMEVEDVSFMHKNTSKI